MWFFRKFLLSKLVQDSNGGDIPESATCNIHQDRYLSHAFEASTFLFFIIPLTAIGILYGLIGLAIRRSALLTRAGSDTSNRSGFTSGLASLGLGADRLEQRTQQHLQTRARLAVIKMLGQWVTGARFSTVNVLLPVAVDIITLN